MDIKTYEKIQTHVEVAFWAGGREQALDISKWVGAGSVYTPPTKEDPREYLQIPTMFGPRDIKAGNYVVKIEDHTFLTYKPEALEAEYKEVLDDDSTIVKHARVELNMFPNEDADFKESIVAAVKGFASYRGHSGSSADIAVHMISALLAGRNLLPLTDNEDEWLYHPKEKYGSEEDVWQNKRNSAAISYDGGMTYFLVTEKKEEVDEYSVAGVRFYMSEPKNFIPEIDAEDLKSDNE